MSRNRPMSYLRYEELKAAGPTITAEDYKNPPRAARKKSTILVRVALLQHRAELEWQAYLRSRTPIDAGTQASGA